MEGLGFLTPKLNAFALVLVSAEELLGVSLTSASAFSEELP